MKNSKKLFLVTLLSLINFNLNCMEQTILENKSTTLSQDETISNPTFYKGKCFIAGQNHNLILENTITIAPNSTLCLKDITIKNADNIKLASNTSNISISGYVILEINNFELNYGNFSILANSQFKLFSANKTQKGNFFYKTEFHSFLNNGATLELENVIFIYSPQDSDDRLISFNSIDSCMQLVNSQIFLETNLHLTNGCMYLKGENLFDGKQGLTLTIGDGANKMQNMPLFLAAGASKEVKNIQIINKNVD